MMKDVLLIFALPAGESGERLACLRIFGIREAESCALVESQQFIWQFRRFLPIFYLANFQVMAKYVVYLSEDKITM